VLEHNFQLIVELYCWPEVLLWEPNHVKTWEQITKTTRDDAIRHGVSNRVVATMLGGEWYNTLLTHQWDRFGLGLPADPYQQADLLCSRLDYQLGEVKKIWPAPAVGLYDVCWNNQRNVPVYYYRPVPSKAEWLGVDAYVPGVITRDGFNRNVRTLIEGSSKNGRPLMLIGQGFTEPGGIWTNMPTVEQMQWWLDLADDYSQIQALTWFLLDWPDWIEKTTEHMALIDYPEGIRGLQWYANYCRQP
jgi:hypothetical protein